MDNRILHSPRGNALVLTLLLMSSLGSLGFLAAQRAGADLAVAGHLARMAQIQATSDMGMILTFAFLAENPGRRMSQLENERREGYLPLNLDRGKTSAMATTQIQRLPLLLPTSTPDSRFLPVARAMQQVAHDSQAYFIKEMGTKGGYSTNAGICYALLDISSRGWVAKLDRGDLNAGVDPETLNLPLSKSRARVTIGPMPCHNSSGND